MYILSAILVLLLVAAILEQRGFLPFKPGTQKQQHNMKGMEELETRRNCCSK